MEEFKSHVCNCALPAITGDTKCCEHCMNNPNRKDVMDCLLGTQIFPNTKSLEEQKQIFDKRGVVGQYSPYVVFKDYPMYQMIADENELKWFFDHVVQKPQVNESYSMVFVCRHKKLTKEEQKTIGLTRSQSEFLATQSVRKKAFTGENADAADSWTFSNFLKHVKRFNVDKYAYTTALGDPLPEKTLAVIFYVNPCDDIKVADAITEQISNAKTALTKALLSGKSVSEMLQHYQVFGNLENNVKHFKANQKGTRYWMDFDLDCPEWFRNQDGEGDGTGYYFDMMKRELNTRFGNGNYIIVSTSGGYHILVKTSSIKANPHDFCNQMEKLYKQGIEVGEYPPYVDEKGNCKFECIVNDSQIPGLPLPGTYQYGRPVTVLNKEDFYE